MVRWRPALTAMFLVLAFGWSERSTATEGQTSDSQDGDGEEVGQVFPKPELHLESPADILERFPPFRVLKRIPVIEEAGFFPCMDCHDNESQIVNPTVRQLEDEHSDLELKHGAGRFWCLTCHHPNERNSLVSLEGKFISFDQSFLLCGQCHPDRQKDFFLGGHGKRRESWRGERLLTQCTECHNAHDPVGKARAPMAAPRLRRGLEQKAVHHPPPKPWERISRERGSAGSQHPADSTTKEHP